MSRWFIPEAIAAKNDLSSHQIQNIFRIDITIHHEMVNGRSSKFDVYKENQLSTQRAPQDPFPGCSHFFWKHVSTWHKLTTEPRQDKAWGIRLQQSQETTPFREQLHLTHIPVIDIQTDTLGTLLLHEDSPVHGHPPNNIDPRNNPPTKPNSSHAVPRSN